MILDYFAETDQWSTVALFQRNEMISTVNQEHAVNIIHVLRYRQ